MIETPRRVFLAIMALALIWVTTYWLYEPTPPPVTFGERPASMREDPGWGSAKAVGGGAADSAVLAQGTATRVEGGRAVMGDAGPVPVDAAIRVGVGPPPRRVREYTVAKGDVSWEAIAAKVYGDRRRALDLAYENPLVDPKRLIPGRTVIRVPLDPLAAPPTRGETSAPAPPTPADPPAVPATPPSPAAPAERTYTIAPGDTLSGIAKRHYGQSSRWLAIFEANRDRIDDPDRLPTGVTIRIPAEPARSGT
jgi:nucleoid-associated protein YgaU